MFAAAAADGDVGGRDWSEDVVRLPVVVRRGMMRRKRRRFEGVVLRCTLTMSQSSANGVRR